MSNKAFYYIKGKKFNLSDDASVEMEHQPELTNKIIVKNEKGEDIFLVEEHFYKPILD